MSPNSLPPISFPAFLLLLLALFPSNSAQWAQPIAQQQQSVAFPGSPLIYSPQQNGLRTAPTPSSFFQPQQPPPQQPPKMRPSHFDPTLKVKSHDGYLPVSAGPGTFVRIAPSVHAAPLQILVEDHDLQPGMPPAVYQYVLSGYGSEHFAVDQHGNLYLADAFDLDGSGASSFVLHVMAREVDTVPKRDSQPISITVHVLEDEHVVPTSTMAQTIYMANISAFGTGERVIAQVKAREGDGSGAVQYRIVEVSDGAIASFRYDQATNELRAVGPLFPGHRYKVIIEARDSDGLAGHAIVLVQALAPTGNNGGPAPPQDGTAPFLPPLSALLPYKPNSPDPMALIPVNSRPIPNGVFPMPDMLPIVVPPPNGMGGTVPTPTTLHPTEQNMFMELSELTPPRTLVTSFGDEHTLGKIHFLTTGGNEQGKFVVDEGTGNVLTNGPLDRERAKEYTLRIEARSRAPFDQLLYLTNLHVTIVDANDNAPQFMGPVPLMLSTRLDELAPTSTQFSQPNLLLGRVHVDDPDQGDNGRVSLRVLPPLDRLFTIDDAGQVRVNGLLSAAHLGEHHLTIMAVDHGQPPQESRAVLSVRIDGHFASNIRETMLGPLPPAIAGLSPFGLALAGQQPQPHPPPPPHSLPSAQSSSSHHSASAATSSHSSSSDYEGDKGTDNNSGGGTTGEIRGSAQESGRHGGQQQTLGGGTDEEEEERRGSSQLAPNRPPPPPFTRVEPHKQQIVGDGANSPLLPSIGPPAWPPQAKTSTPNVPSESELDNFHHRPARPPAIDHPPPATSPPPPSPPSIRPSTPFPSSASSSVEEFGGGTRLAPIFQSAELKLFVEENEGQMELAQLVARYPDDGPGPIHYVLLAGDQSLFSVNASTGQVILLKELDAESEMQPPIYKLKVGTAEAGTKAGGEFLQDPELAHSCELTVHVIDINDWIPNFEQDHYDFGIPATAEKGTVLGQVTAFDQDLTAPNNKIQYRLLGPPPTQSTPLDASGLFKIDPDSGQISLAADSLATLAGRRLAFRVQAMDGGIDGTELNSTAELMVHVEGIRAATTTTTMEMKLEQGNEGAEEGEELVETSTTTMATAMGSSSAPPSPAISSSQRPPPLASHPSANSIHFAMRQFNASIMEGTRPPVLVLTLEVRNKPKDTRFTICAIRTGNFRSVFSVATNADGDCELRTQVQLDREAIAHYRLNISVENGGQMDWTVANVSVLDVNDNKPKFVFPSAATGDGNNTAATTMTTSSSFFAVLPVETAANQRFFKLNAIDADEPGTGNSVVHFKLDPTHGDDVQYFGIDPKNGELWPVKRPKELVQLTKKNYFKLAVIACDNPTEPIRQLCSRALVTISLLDDQHRFLLTFVGTSPEKIRRQEKDIAHSLRPFTSPCSNPQIERVEERPEGESGQSLVTVLMYAANVKERKLCLKQEIHKMFSPDAKEALASAMRQWGAELVEVMGVAEAGRSLRKNGERGAPGEGTTEGLAALLFPIDWGNASTVLIAISVGVALIALVGLCALFLFRARHKQMRRRAEQMRRRHHQHRGGFNAAGLLAVNGGAKGAHHQSVAPMNGLFTAGLPSSYAPSSNISNNLYMPSGTPLGSGGPNFERGNKFYESQMLELPIGDGDEFMHRTNGGNGVGRATGTNGHGGGLVHAPNCHNGGHGGHMNNNHRHAENEAAQNGSSSSKSSPNRRHYSSGILPPPPPPASQRQFQQQQKSAAAQNGRRLTNSDNAAAFPQCAPGTSAAAGYVLRRHNSPPAAVGGNNQEGDFSIDESFYVANGQSRYHFH